MGGHRKPGPQCVTDSGVDWIDNGTLCLTRTTPPGPLIFALATRWVPPLASSKPARSLSKQEARDLVVHYAMHGLLRLEQPITFDKEGQVKHPRVGERVRLELLQIGGVKFTADSAAAADWAYTSPLDARTAVLCVRLAQFLKAGRWGVTTIYWGGLGVGRKAGDRHDQGFALDFHGADTNAGTLNVQRDWGDQPIHLPKGKTVGSWPAGIAPFYRLDVGTTAGGFFQDVYQFLTGEAADAAQPSSIGGRSRILHPDTPDRAMLDSHQNHIHCEIDR